MTEHYLGVKDAAATLGRTQQAFLAAGPPEPDVMVGKTRGWSTATLEDWDLHRRRPGRYPSTKASKQTEGSTHQPGDE